MTKMMSATAAVDWKFLSRFVLARHRMSESDRIFIKFAEDLITAPPDLTQLLDRVERAIRKHLGVSSVMEKEIMKIENELRRQLLSRPSRGTGNAFHDYALVTQDKKGRSQVYPFFISTNRRALKENLIIIDLVKNKHSSYKNARAEKYRLTNLRRGMAIDQKIFFGFKKESEWFDPWPTIEKYEKEALLCIRRTGSLDLWYNLARTKARWECDNSELSSPLGEGQREVIRKRLPTLEQEFKRLRWEWAEKVDAKVISKSSKVTHLDQWKHGRQPPDDYVR